MTEGILHKMTVAVTPQVAAANITDVNPLCVFRTLCVAKYLT